MVLEFCIALSICLWEGFLIESSNIRILRLFFLRFARAPGLIARLELMTVLRV